MSLLTIILAIPTFCFAVVVFVGILWLAEIFGQAIRLMFFNDWGVITVLWLSAEAYSRFS